MVGKGRGYGVGSCSEGEGRVVSTGLLGWVAWGQVGWWQAEAAGRSRRGRKRQVGRGAVQCWQAVVNQIHGVTKVGAGKKWEAEGAGKAERPSV